MHLFWESDSVKKSYIKCLKKLREFRKSLNTEKDLKRGKLYFEWIKEKTEKIENEKDNHYIYKNVVKYTLKNYKIDKYNYERLNKQLKNITCFHNHSIIELLMQTYEILRLYPNISLTAINSIAIE